MSNPVHINDLDKIRDHATALRLRAEMIERLNAMTDAYIRGEFELIGFPRKHKKTERAVFIKPKLGMCASGVLHTVRFDL